MTKIEAIKSAWQTYWECKLDHGGGDADSVDAAIEAAMVEFKKAQVAWHTADSLQEAYNLTDEEWAAAVAAQVEAIKFLRQYFGGK